MKSLLIASAAVLALLAGAAGAGAQTQKQTDPAHPLTNPSAPTSDCRSDSMRGGDPPCGPTNTQPNGAQPAAPRQNK
jgi:hypothetical protein